MRKPRNSKEAKRRSVVLMAILMFSSVANSAGITLPDYRVSVGRTKHSDTAQFSAVFNVGSPQIFAIQNFELALGTISSSGNDEVFLSLGPKWRWPLVKQNLYFDFGFSPTLISGSSFDGQELGGKFHFTSSLSVGSKFGHRKKMSLSLRIQHTSNGGLNRPNPGMDMIGLEFSLNAPN